MIVMDEFPNELFSGPFEAPEEFNGTDKGFAREFRVRK